MKKILLTTLAFVVTLALAAEPAPFELKENDRVLFLGDGIVERDIGYNYLETMLTVRTHGKNVTFRNAGWSGDTVWGESRAVFGQQKDGYNSLIKIVNETRPTVIFLFYGMNESFAGPAGLAHFEEGYNALLDNVLNPAKDAEHVAAPPAQSTNRRDPKDVAKPQPPKPRDVPRIVLVSPIAFSHWEYLLSTFRGKDHGEKSEAFLAAFPKTSPVNENLKLYTQTIQKLASARGARFVNLFEAFGGENILKHTTDHMYVTNTHDGMHLTSWGYLNEARAILEGLGFGKQDISKYAANSKFDGYEPIDPRQMINKDSPLENLRALIAEKNVQFFNKWRPQNETYLFLFRKHEQGRNAKEIPEFDPFITAKEAEIAKAADEAAKALGL